MVAQGSFLTNIRQGCTFLFGTKRSSLFVLNLATKIFFYNWQHCKNLFFVALIVARNKLASLSLTTFWLNQHLLTVLNQSACREQERSILFVFNVTRIQRKKVLRQ